MCSPRVSSRPSGGYVREHLLDLAFVALPMLRPLRALRVRLLRAGTAAAVAGERYRERVISRAALFAFGTAIGRGRGHPPGTTWSPCSPAQVR